MTLVLSAALAGCGDGATGGATAAAASASRAGSSEDRLLQEYLEVFAVGDAAQLRSAWVPLTAPRSLARLYSEHHATFRQALEDTGNAPAREDTVEVTADGVQICTPSMGDACRSYTEPVAVDGRLSSFTVNGLPLAGAVAQPGARAGAEGLEVELVSAYETSRGALFVCVRATNASAGPVSVNVGTAAYAVPGMPEQAAGTAPGPLDPLAAGASAVSCPVFQTATLGGVLRLEPTGAAGTSMALELPVAAAAG